MNHTNISCMQIKVDLCIQDVQGEDTHYVKLILSQAEYFRIFHKDFYRKSL